MSNAEQLYRDAFLRLKQGKPLRLKKGAPVTQNNVAKEAGRDPSALKKSRFPELIREIKNAFAATPESLVTFEAYNRGSAFLKDTLK